ncbi:patatin-like phospholipase family protein [Anaerolinea sp.]|uniref:patatin-like phospholipase family protein n=1 Tax=Anaerolinea sp. TaxID=1872519 RepID=UPI002ACD982D|nr:patatin-like phospholipase family protein [Anaerolinea sp.]
MDIALALGGGGVKGIAHIGVLQALEQAGFRIRAIAGTSIGGLVGGVYAAGNSPLKILQTVQQLDMNLVYKRRAEDGPALLGHAGMVEVLNILLHNRRFEDLEIPFACTAVDIHSHREVYLTKGDVIQAILATTAFPGVLPPQEHKEMLLVDGGVLDPVPVLLARKLAPNLPVLAVVLQPPPEDWDKIPEGDLITTTPLPIPSPLIQGFIRMRIGQAARIFIEAMDINSRMLTELRLHVDKPDFVLRPNVFRFGIFEPADPLVLFNAGKEIVEQKLGQIRDSFSWKGKLLRFLKADSSSTVLKILKSE